MAIRTGAKAPAGRRPRLRPRRGGRRSAVRHHLLAERGIPRESVSISGYWKRAGTEDGWREDKPEWNRLVEADLSAAH